MRKTYEYNPGSGTYTQIEDHPDGGIILKTMQDVQPVLDHIERKRNSGKVDKGIKRGMWHYATIPGAVWMKWKAEDGIDIFNKDHTAAICKKLNEEYPKLKNTRLTHSQKN